MLLEKCLAMPKDVPSNRESLVKAKLIRLLEDWLELTRFIVQAKLK